MRPASWQAHRGIESMVAARTVVGAVRDTGRAAPAGSQAARGHPRRLHAQASAADRLVRQSGAQQTQCLCGTFPRSYAVGVTADEALSVCCQLARQRSYTHADILMNAPP